MHHRIDALYLIPAAFALVVALYVTVPSLLVIVALPATVLVTSRLGAAGGGNSLTLSDTLLFIGSFAALTLVSRPVLSRLRPYLGLFAVYQFAMLLSVLHSPNRYDAVEWFHQLVMVGGSMVVGAVLVQRGKAKTAVNAFMALCMIGSLWAIVGTATHGWHPGNTSFPLGVQKNFIGDVLVVAVLLAQVNPPWARLNQAWIRPTKYLCVAGVLASQSRQSIIALIITIAVLTLKGRQLERRAKVLLVALVPLAVAAYVTLSDQLANLGQTNSISIRQAKLTQTLTIWRTSPFLGVGERYWYTKKFPGTIQPPNAEVGTLATAGVLGLACFVVFVLGTLWLLWRLPPAGIIAFAVMLAHVIAGQFDIFWVTGSGALPWMIVGMAVTATATATITEAKPDPPPESQVYRVRRAGIPPGPTARTPVGASALSEGLGRITPRAGGAAPLGPPGRLGTSGMSGPAAQLGPGSE